jgi:hypothetical protein
MMLRPEYSPRSSRLTLYRRKMVVCSRRGDLAELAEEHKQLA